MKKQLTFLCALLFLMAGTTFAQGIYQLPNSDFNDWPSSVTNNNATKGDAIPTS